MAVDFVDRQQVSIHSNSLLTLRLLGGPIYRALK